MDSTVSLPAASGTLMLAPYSADSDVGIATETVGSPDEEDDAASMLMTWSGVGTWQDGIKLCDP